MTYSITSGAYAVGVIKKIDGLVQNGKTIIADEFISYVQLARDEMMVRVPGRFTDYADANMAGRAYYLTNAKPGTLY